MNVFGSNLLRSSAWGFLKSLGSFSGRNEKGLARLVSTDDLKRIQKYSDCWDFYEGYHWQKIGDLEKEAHTENWCRRFVNKFVYTEFNNGFRLKFNEQYEERILPFLNSVWSDNHKETIMQLIGQCKGVTGDAYLQVEFLEPGEFDDPYGLYPKGRIKLYAVPSSIVFPKYRDGYEYEQDAIESVAIIYPVEAENTIVDWVQFYYTRDTITVIRNGNKTEYKNKYGVIPIFHFKNFMLSGNNFGISDLEDLIPLNSQLNLKNSDVSEIIDYHSAPTTIIYGARINNLERGANKIWGGLPSDAKVENLELKSDLTASNNFINRLEETMYKLSGIPSLSLGGSDVNSNVSGYALNIALMPLTETVTSKRFLTGETIEEVNKLIIKIGVEEGLLTGVEDIPNNYLYNHSIEFGEMIPRDSVRELEQLQQEFKMGLEDRRGAMVRLGKENVEEKLKAIDKEREKYPFIYGKTSIAMPTTSRLVDVENGKVILKEKEQPMNEFSNESGKVQFDEKRAVGKNREGEDKKVISGENNKNVE